MSANDSNLSISGYNYDLVCAITQNGLNSNLKSFLSMIGRKYNQPLITYYKYASSSNKTVIEISHNEMRDITGFGDFDIFKVPDNTKPSNPDYSEVGNKLAAAGFAYALKTTTGIPNTPADAPDVVLLNFTEPNDPSKLRYDMYFRTFEVVELSYSQNSWTFINKKQKKTAPWIFQWYVRMQANVPVRLGYSQLPEDIRQQIDKNYRSSATSFFTLQQLVLDLNSGIRVPGNRPDIGFDKNDPIYDIIERYLNNYWIQLINSGGVVLTSSVQPDNIPPSSIIPTGYAAVVGHYRGAGKSGLDTLQYLVKSEQRPLQYPITASPWDWVDNTSLQGIMSARRDLFMSYLNKALSPSLDTICKKISVDIDNDRIILNPNKTAQTYVYPEKEPTTLIFSYESYAKEHKWKFTWINLLFPKYISLQSRLKVDSKVVVKDDVVNCSTTVSLYVEYDIDGFVSQTKGYPLAQRNDTVFKLTEVGIQGSEAGRLLVQAKTTITDLTQTKSSKQPYYNGDLDPSLVAKFMTRGDANTFAREVDLLRKEVKELMNGYDAIVLSAINNSFGWVFPGSQNFFFKNPKFSKHGDLTVEVRYQDPS